MTPNIVKICKLPPPSPLNWLSPRSYISKTLEIVNVSKESNSFKPCTEAEINFVEIKFPFLTRFDTYLEAPAHIL